MTALRLSARMRARLDRGVTRLFATRLLTDPLDQGRWALALFFAFLLVEKLLFNRHGFGYGIDGGYYAEIARHVRDGHGLVTRVSLYHHGYAHFPHPTPVYPLWPLLLGYVARLIPLEVAALWLPTLLYFVTLGLGYRWANETWPEPLTPTRLPWLRAGHLLVVILGLNRAFYEFTSLPYTEGLAFALLFAMLWRARALTRRPGVLAGVEMGAWLALLVLTRSQLVVAVLAVAFIFAWKLVASRERRRLALAGLAAATTLVLGVLPHWLFVRRIVPGATLVQYLEIDRARPNTLLSALDFSVHTGSLVGDVLDRLAGIGAALNPLGQFSYVRSFYGFIYIVPFAAGLAVWAFVRQRPRGSALLARASADARWPQRLAFVFAVGNLLVVHLIHKDYISPWMFARRHAIPVVFAVVVAFVWVLRHSARWARLTAAVLFVASLGIGAQQVNRLARQALKPVTSRAAEKQDRDALAAWLEAQVAPLGALDVAVDNNEAQRLGWRTHRVNYHWIYETTTLEDLRRLVAERQVRYLVLERRDDTPRPWTASRFGASEDAFLALFRPLDVPLERFVILAPETTSPSRAGPR